MVRFLRGPACNQVKRIPLPLVLALLSCALGGCALFRSKAPVIPDATLPSWIGRVVMVDSVNRFVLVDTGAGVHPPPGGAVMTLREKRRTGLLQVTEDARPPYVAMQILEGDPQLGDQAVLDEGREAPAPAADDT